MKTVLFLHHTFPVLTATFVYREARALARSGAPPVHFAFKRPDGRVVSRDAQDFLRQTHYAAGLRHPFFWARVLAAFLLAPGRTVGLFWRMLGAQSPATATVNLARGLYAADFVDSHSGIGHIHAPFSTDIATIAMIASSVTGVSWSFSSHTAFDDTLVAEKVDSASFVRSISAFDRERLLARTSRRHGARIHVVHCGVEPEAWPFLPTRRASEKPVILSVGTLQEKKGHSILIGAVHRLLDAGVEAKLKIVGGGPMREELARRIEELGLAGTVELAGELPHEEVQALYAESDLLALASVYASDGDLDGIPVVLMEAMASGVPCVSTKVSGIPELIEDGKEGLLADERDVEGLARRLEEALTDDDLRRRIARGARRKIEREFNLARTAAKLAALIGRCLEGGRSEAAGRAKKGRRRVPSVAFVTPLPTPYRQPLLDRLAALDDIKVTVFYCSRGEADRSWAVGVRESERHRFLPGFRITVGGAKTFYNHINPAIWRELGRGDFDVVVTSGYALATSELAIAWALAHRRPYVIHSESHSPPERSCWRRLAKELFLRPVLAAAAAGCATGTLAREYLAHYGLPRERIRILPNTADVHGIAKRVEELSARRDEVRRSLGLKHRFVAIFVGRLIAAKAPLELLDAYEQVCRRRGDCALLVVGDGELEGELRRRISERGLGGARLCGFRQGDALLELYAASDIFILPSRQEPWGVVVNEAAAAGLPLLLSDAVGAGADLLEPGKNGEVFPSGSVELLAREWCGLLDSDALSQMGALSRRIVERWDYDFAVEEFTAAVRLALSDKG